eukprot:15459811-Alexandrium_andersonii.AAC.1
MPLSLCEWCIGNVGGAAPKGLRGWVASAGRALGCAPVTPPRSAGGRPTLKETRLHACPDAMRAGGSMRGT